MIHTILLDVDGVLNVGAPWFMRAAGVKIRNDDIDAYPAGFQHDDLVGATNSLLMKQGERPLSATQFWECSSNREFWADFPTSPEFSMILVFAEGLVGQKNVHLLTSTTLSPECLAGKLEWITKRLPRFLHRQYLMGPQKYLCAKPGALLIDDADKNVDAFRRAGGEALLVPRPWNSLKTYQTQGFLHDAFRELEERSRMFGGPGGHQAG